MKERYENACNAYLSAFASKHGLEIKPYWIGDEIGGVADFDYITVGFDTMRYDIDNNVPVEMFDEWYDYSIEVLSYGISAPNLKSWHHGCPRLGKKELRMLNHLSNVLDGRTIKF